MPKVIEQFVRTRFESERENLMLLARRSKFDALLRMGIFLLLSTSLSVGFGDNTFVIWFWVRVTTTLLAGMSIGRFQANPTPSALVAVFFAYVLDALPFFWLISYLWVSFDAQYQLISVLMLAAGFIYSLTHRLSVPSLGLIYVAGIQICFTVFWVTQLMGAEPSDVAVTLTIMALQFYHALTMHETFTTLSTIDGAARRGEATKRLEAMGRVAAGVAHAFNNHLAAIVGGLDLARSRTTDPETASNLALAMEAARHAGADVERLLAYTQQFPLRPVPCRLVDVMAELEARLSATRRGGATLRSEVAKGIPRLYVDRTQLLIALTELVNNAQEAGANEVILRARADDQRIDIAVTDNGAGVAPELAERVFEPFFSAPATPQKPGLGLSMIRGFVAQSGGTVAIDPTVDAGTTIVLSFPIDDARSELRA